MATFQHLMMFPIGTPAESIDAVLETVKSFTDNKMTLVSRGVRRPPIAIDHRNLRIAYAEVEVVFDDESTMDELADTLMDEHGVETGGPLIKSFTIVFARHQPTGSDPTKWPRMVEDFWRNNPVFADDFTREPDPMYLYIEDIGPQPYDEEPEPVPQPVSRLSKEALLERYSNSRGKVFNPSPPPRR